MSKLHSRSGGKFGGSHTTFIPAAAIAADVATSCDKVSKVSPGIINMSRGKSGTRRNVRIIDGGHCILLVVTDGAAHQEVRVFTSDAQAAKLCIARGVRNDGLSIGFGSRISK
jgi:hypothetical protein